MKKDNHPYESGTLVMSHFRGGSGAFSIDRESVVSPIQRREVAIVLHDSNDGWLLLITKHSRVVWSRSRGFSSDV